MLCHATIEHGFEWTPAIVMERTDNTALLAYVKPGGKVNDIAPAASLLAQRSGGVATHLGRTYEWQVFLRSTIDEHITERTTTAQRRADHQWMTPDGGRVIFEKAVYRHDITPPSNPTLFNLTALRETKMNLKIDTKPRPITEAAIAEMSAALREAVTVAQQKIDMAGQVCNALHPIRHHKKVDGHLEGVISKHLGDVHVSCGVIYNVVRLRVSWRTGSPNSVNIYARAELQIDFDRTATVADVIARLTELGPERKELGMAERQLQYLEDLLDGEMLLRELIANFEATRQEIEDAVLGPRQGPYRHYFNETVNKHLTTLTAH